MKSITHYKRHYWLIFASSIIFLIISLGAFFSIYVENEIKENIFLLHGNFSSVRVNLFMRSIKVNDLKWSSESNSTNSNPHLLQLSCVTAKGINLYELFLNETIQIEVIAVESGIVRYNRNIKQTRQKINKAEYKHFIFKNITLHNIATEITNDTIDSFSALINGKLGALNIQIDSLNNLDYSLDDIDALVENVSLSRQEGMYGGTIARIHLNSAKKKIVIDSALLIPNLGKYEFAHRHGKQIARIDLIIPQLIISGLQFEKISDSSFVATKMEINSFNLTVFKDKRVPFIRHENIPLPMESLVHLPWSIKIDSISIMESHILIEEYPEHGNTSGKITFDHINAYLTNLNNRRKDNEPTHAQMHVKAQLLEAGNITSSFQFPLDGSPTYSAKGSVSSMSFTKFNPVLSALANLRVESGYLNELSFHFNYTDLHSEGTLNIDYSDLQVMSLDKNHHATDGFKTFLMNAILKNKRSQSPTSSVRTATINIERDRKRYIFNVWWKSIQDGLKSSVLGSTRK